MNTKIETGADNSSGEGTSIKKRKNNLGLEVASIHSTKLENFKSFMFKRILIENSSKKTVVVEGVFENTDGVALLLLEKLPFSKETLLEGFLTGFTAVSKEFSNAVFGNYSCQPTTACNGVKATIIHPATEEHVRVFEPKPLHIVHETFALYEQVSVPLIQTRETSCQRIRDILDHKREADLIVYENDDPEVGFILLPDWKWDKTLVNNMYMVALVHKRGLKSLRDLNADHLPLLKNIYSEGMAAIEEKYKLPASQIQIFLQYHASYYHLHVNFTNVMFDASGIFTEKCHLLNTVISNIELQSDYYQKSLLSFIVKEGEMLFNAFEAAGEVKRCIVKNSDTQGGVIEID